MVFTATGTIQGALPCTPSLPVPSTHHRPFPRAVPKGPAAPPHLPGNAAAPRLASAGSVGIARAPATRPHPCQDVCLCPQKGEGGGWLASPLPQSQAAAHPQAPPSLGPDMGGTRQEGGPRALPEPASLPAGPSHSPVSRVNCPSPHPPKPQGPCAPLALGEAVALWGMRVFQQLSPKPRWAGPWHPTSGMALPGRAPRAGGRREPFGSMSLSARTAVGQELPKASSTCP